MLREKLGKIQKIYILHISISVMYMKVLIIEDNLQLATNMVRFLSMHDILAETVQNGKE